MPIIVFGHLVSGRGVGGLSAHGLIDSSMLLELLSQLSGTFASAED